MASCLIRGFVRLHGGTQIASVVANQTISSSSSVLSRIYPASLSLGSSAAAAVVGIPSSSSSLLQSSIGFSISGSGTLLGAVRWDSTKRKRIRKMNKHKYQKMKKRMRNLTAKNVRGKNA